MSAPGAAVCFGAGLLLGGVHFGLLWATIRRLPEARHPGLLAAASLVGRIAILAGGLVVVVVQGGALHLLVALAGVLAARTVVMRRVRPGGREVSWS